MAVVIETTLGDITVDLYLDQRPATCLNFLKLCKMKYYNYNLFHTIRSGFIAQTGDPTGEGAGGQSIWGILEGPDKRFFSGEKRPKIRHTDVGLVSMVCTEDMMVGSQFFITLAPDLDSLDGTHCVIGEVTEGHEVLTKLNEVICDESHRPYRDVRITHTVVLEDPFNDPPGLRAPSRSPSPNSERLKGGRIAPDEEIDETQGKSAEEIQEMIEEKEAKARATILEIVGDLPDADIAPPENVLFVCKLNPVTTDEDLEIIFSRFGKIVSCEVIRDKKTGNSLQYAFIEFENKKSCEDSYFKMDNVLIDDRRIHVDFSQSVSKMRWLGKGRGVQYFDEEPKKKSNNENKRHRGDITDKKEREYQSNGKRHGNSRIDREQQHRDHKMRDRHYRTNYGNDRDNNRNNSEKEIRNKEERDRHYKDNRERGRKNRDSRERKKHRRDRSRSRSEINNCHEMKSKNRDKYTKELDNESSRSHRYKNDYNKNNHHKSTSPLDKNYDTGEGKKKEINRYQKDKESEHHQEKRHPENKGKKHTQNEPKTPSPIMDKKEKTSKQKKVGKSHKRSIIKSILKKKRKQSTTSESSDSTSSSSDSSSSSESDNRKKKLRRKKRHHSTSSSSVSSTSSSSTSSSDSSSSSSSSDGKTRERKHAKTTRKHAKSTKHVSFGKKSKINL